LAWQARTTALFALLGILCSAWALLGTGHTLVVQAGMAMLFFSLALFLVAWALIGHLFAVVEPDVSRYAQLSAVLSSRVKQPVLRKP